MIPDTSVWIDYIQGREAKQVDFLDDLMKNPLAVGVSDLIFMEVLQAAKDQKTFDQLRSYFSGQQFYRFTDPELSHASAAQIFYDCRRQGITVRSTLDCLIAQCAIEYELTLLHHDRDFKHMAMIIPALQHKQFLE